MKTSACIFDMDGVLCDTIPFHVEAWHTYSRERGRELADGEIIAWMGADNRFYLERILGREPSEREVEECVARKESLFRELSRGCLRPPPGLHAFMDGLRTAGMKLAVATGAPPDNVEFILGGLGLAEFFPVVVDSAAGLRCKPAPDCYLKAAELLGAPPEECIVFEDATGGIAAAKAAGMRVAAIVGTNTRETLEAAAPDWIFDSFEEAGAAGAFAR